MFKDTKGSWRKPLRVLVCVAHLAHLKLLLLLRTTRKTNWYLTWTHSLHHKNTALDSGDEGAVPALVCHRRFEIFWAERSSWILPVCMQMRSIPNYLMHEETQSIIISTATPALHADGNLSRVAASHFPAHVMTDTCISLTPDFSFRAKDWLMLQEKKVTQSLILFIWT